jgi:hypothetical protein
MFYGLRGSGLRANETFRRAPEQADPEEEALRSFYFAPESS